MTSVGGGSFCEVRDYCMLATSSYLAKTIVATIRFTIAVSIFVPQPDTTYIFSFVPGSHRVKVANIAIYV